MRTKTFLLIATVVCTSSVLAQSVPSTDEIMSQARAVAAKDKKAVWVIFHASWWGWCKRLDKFIEDANNNKILTKYFVPVHVTVLESPEKKSQENAGGDKLLEALQGSKAGLPFFAFVGADNKLIINSLLKKEPDAEGQNIGHPMEPHEIAWFIKMVTTAAPKMTKEEVATLDTWLRSQKIK